MQNNSHLDEDDQPFAKLPHNAAGFTSRYRWAIGLSLVLVLVIIGLSLFGLSTSGLVANPGCGALALDSTCQRPSHPTVVTSPTVAEGSISIPTATPTSIPSPTATPGVASSQAPTPTPFPELTDQQVVTNTVQRYENHVVVDGPSRKAYNLLSGDLQASEPYNDFIQNPNYTLKKGCWIPGAMHVSQKDSLTWDVGVELTQVSCVDTTPIAHFEWHFEVQNQNGLFVITSVGLYPTGSQSQ